jgi:uncharacterized Rmd1/YagE family protein
MILWYWGNNMKVIAIADAEKYKLNNLQPFMASDIVIQLFHNIVYLKYKEEEVFLFPFGVRVFWFNDTLIDFTNGRLEVINPHKQKQIDELDVIRNNHFNIKEDEVTLPNDLIETKLAISYAIAQSTKISYYEYKVALLVEQNNHIPRDLINKGKIALSRSELQRRLGQLFIEKHYINLNSDIISAPDIIWELPEIEEYFNKTFKYLDIQKRVDLLNQQLNTLNELFDMLKHDLDINHSSKLEWIIIILIAFEIIMNLIEKL